jgi:hypothetical protein
VPATMQQASSCPKRIRVLEAVATAQCVRYDEHARRTAESLGEGRVGESVRTAAWVEC